jgi:hypothetical protein
MRKLGIIVGSAALLLVILVGSAIAWYKTTYPTYTYRYRMTVEVEVNGKVRSGSSVIEVRLIKQPEWPGSGSPVHAGIMGEAVVVGLGEGRSLIALLATGPNASDIDYPAHVVPVHFKLSYDDQDLVKYPRLTGSWQLDPAMQRALGLPTLVTFTDSNDPDSAHIVQPDEFERFFGPGVNFRRVWVEMTKDTMTEGIEKKLPWWNGPFPSLKPIGGGGAYVNESDGFRWNKQMFKRGPRS